jgi:hypothetical protein
MTAPTEQLRPPIGRAALWFAFLGGPVAWTAHLLASYPLVSVACRLGSATPLHLITLSTALIAAAAALTGWVGYRRVRDAQGPAGMGDALARARFMALGGVFIGGLFTFVILVEGLPPLLHDPCLRDL